MKLCETSLQPITLRMVNVSRQCCLFAIGMHFAVQIGMTIGRKAVYPSLTKEERASLPCQLPWRGSRCRKEEAQKNLLQNTFFVLFRPRKGRGIEQLTVGLATPG